MSGELHRDDIDMDLMDQIEEELGKQFPGMKVVCLGDVPEDQRPPELVQAMSRLEESLLVDLVNLRCADCGKQIPNLPRSEEELDEWDLPDGWFVFSDKDDKVVAIQCPECDAKGEG